LLCRCLRSACERRCPAVTGRGYGLIFGGLPPASAVTGLAVATVQKAIRLLEGENYVLTISGRGTFVTPRNRDAKDSGR
jgi:hypothetical protein